MNHKAIKAFEADIPKLSNLQTEIVTNLNTKGIHVTNLSELFPKQDYLADLLEYLKKREGRSYVNSKKPFLEDLIAEIPELGIEVPFFRLSTEPTILNIVNSYLGMQARMNHVTVRRTRLVQGNLPSHSQNWHRAPQEWKNCRVYVYLSDVDENSGPFMYVPESTKNKRYSSVAQHSPLTRGYNSAEVVESQIPASDILTVLGKAGTVIFCDSTGLHRGGYSTQNTRTMSTFGYSAPSFRENIHYSYSSRLIDALGNNKLAISCLNPKWMRSN